MNNIEFKNEKIKEFYNLLTNTHFGLSSVVSLFQEKKTIVESIISDSYNVYLSLKSNDELSIIEINLLKNKIYLKLPDKPYREIYDDIPKKMALPIGFEYQNNDNYIIKKNIFNKEDNKNKKYYYDIYLNDHNYNIVINDDKNIFIEDIFIKKVLYSQKTIKGIRDLIKIILDNFNKSITIKIVDNIGSIVIINDGNITKYEEYRDKDNEYQKIYLENDEFFIEKRIKEAYKDEMTEYIKKLGDNNGKEKR